VEYWIEETRHDCVPENRNETCHDLGGENMTERWTCVELRRENVRHISTCVDLCLENAYVNRGPEWREEPW
jgi:hypothetical protein